MKIKLKGQYGMSKAVSEDDRGRTYEIGEIKAGVNLTDDGLVLLITNHDLAENLRYMLKQEKIKDKLTPKP